MRTGKSEREAQKATALARAKRWRDERREPKSPATKAAVSKSATPRRSPPKRSGVSTRASSKASTEYLDDETTVTAPKRAPSRARTESTDDDSTVQYRKTPSNEDRAKARAKARAQAKSNAAKWSAGRKKKRVLHAEEDAIDVPAVVETVDAEVEDLTCVDDFKTAPATEVQTEAGKVMSKHDLNELHCLKKDMENNASRLQNFCSRFSMD